MRDVLRDAGCGPSAKAGPLRLRRRHFLFEGDDFGVDRLGTVAYTRFTDGGSPRRGRAGDIFYLRS